MRTEELAYEVALRLAGRDTAGRRTPRFVRVQDTWLVRDPQTYQWTAAEDPLTLVRAALAAYLMEQGGRLSAPQYRALVELCADEATPAEVLALLAAEPSFCLETVRLCATGNEDWLRLLVGRPVA